MHTSGIAYRKCTLADVAEAVPLIFESGPDAFNYVFKTKSTTSEGFLKSAFVTKGGEFSFDNHYVMLFDENIIGVGSVFSANKANTFASYEFMKIVKFYRWKFLPIVIRGLRIEHIIKLPKKSEISLAHITIHSDYRGRGYGQQLMEFLMSETIAAKDSEFVLDVSEKNPRAKAMYERMGFIDQKYNQSKLKSDFGSVTNHYRMSLLNNSN